MVAVLENIETSIIFEAQQWEIIDNFSDYQGWVGLSSGDIYLEGKVYGHYIAVWYPNKKQAVKMIIMSVDEQTQPKCSIGVEIIRGDTLEIKPIPHERLPWESDGIIFSEIIAPEHYSSFARAEEAFNLVKLIVKGDKSLDKYLLNSAVIVCDD